MPRSLSFNNCSIPRVKKADDKIYAATNKLKYVIVMRKRKLNWDSLGRQTLLILQPVKIESTKETRTYIFLVVTGTGTQQAAKRSKCTKS